jgi:phosphopantothenoylcysteine decarboxylase/phosphopantothenate--cysteine ligase
MSNSILNSKRVIITAGPTREAIDPVRYISNHSTGKMGYAIAEYLLSLGANVHIVSGPVSLNHQIPLSRITNVVSADEMLYVSRQLADEADLIIFTAAVADYKCATIADQKIKKKDHVLSIDLIPNPDIAFELSKSKKMNQTFIGFALETENGLENAFSKMTRKGFDSVILNIHSSIGSGFGHDTNKIQIIDNDFSITDYALKQKSDVAVDIVNHIAYKLAKKEHVASYAE